MGATQTLLSIAGWAFIPDNVTNLAVQLLHTQVFPFFNLVPPQPGTPQYRKHHRYTFGIAVLGFLLYTLVQGATSMQPSYYELMQVEPDIDDSGLKQAFRQFAKKYHPDRVGPQGEAFFIKVRDAFEALKDPVVRYAYDRFGPDVLRWKDCSTPRQYLKRGLLQSIGFHVVSLLGILFWSAVGSSPLPFWRYTLYLACFATELSLIVHASPSSGFLTDVAAPSTTYHVFRFILPQQVQYQHILYLHQVLVFMNVALGRVAPRVFPDDIVLDDVAAIKTLRALVSLADKESSELLNGQAAAIRSTPGTTALPQSSAVSPELLSELSREMEHLIIESNLRKDSGPLKSACDQAIQKKRTPLFKAPSTPRTPQRSGNGILPSPDGTPGADHRIPGSWGKSGRVSFHRSPSSYVRGRSISC